MVKKTYEDMEMRFKDLLELNIPVWVLIPFEVNIADVEIDLQEELIELQSDETPQSLFKKGKHDVWKNSDIVCIYPLFGRNLKYVIVFPSFPISCGIWLQSCNSVVYKKS